MIVRKKFLSIHDKDGCYGIFPLCDDRKLFHYSWTCNNRLMKEIMLFHHFTQ